MPCKIGWDDYNLFAYSLQRQALSGRRILVMSALLLAQSVTTEILRIRARHRGESSVSDVVTSSLSAPSSTVKMLLVASKTIPCCSTVRPNRRSCSSRIALYIAMSHGWSWNMRTPSQTERSGGVSWRRVLRIQVMVKSTY